MINSFKDTFSSFVAAFTFLCATTIAQTPANNPEILSAMKDELNRNMDSISYNGYEKPFFISYTLFSGNAVRVEASSGAIKNAVSFPVINSWTRIMVGDYQLNDENYVDRTNRISHNDGNSTLALNNDYWAIRRHFWLSTNNIYKSAAESYKSKTEAMALKGIDKDSLELDDFSKAPVIKHIEHNSFEPFELSTYKTLAREVSDCFKQTPSIYSNDVDLIENNTNCFFINSEGTEVTQSISACGLMIKAFAYTPDFQTEGAFLSYVGKTVTDIPPTEQIKDDVNKLIAHIEEKKELPVFEESYVGPILFMGQAVPKYLIYKLLGAGKGLVAQRRQLVNSADKGLNLTEIRTWENRLNKRVIDQKHLYLLSTISTKREWRCLFWELLD